MNSFPLLWVISILVINASKGVPFNQPKFCPNASWNPDGTTFARNDTVGSDPYALFITNNDTLVSYDQNQGQIRIWINESLTKSIPTRLSEPWGLFVTSNHEILINAWNSTGNVERWMINGTKLLPSISFSESCAGLAVDSTNSIYCSLSFNNRIQRKSLNNITGPATLVAGTGSAGTGPTMLNGPWGIFVTTNSDLYVADSNNHRIQLFRPGQLNGTTVAGSGANGTITLSRPTGVTLDAEGYLFIVDSGNHRIIGSDSNGFRCIVGCSGSSGFSSNQLNNPQSLSFDSKGNLFVTDNLNSRIQKFMISTSSCNCFPPKVTLIPSTSKMNSPLVFRRAQDFYLSSIIDVQCNVSLAFNINWSFFLCTSSGCNNVTQLDSSIPTIFSDLYIPSRTLAIGLYEIRLTATMAISPSLSTTKLAYVRIISSGITANLVPLGTSMITSGHTMDLEFNPGLYSIDRDGFSLNASEWDYHYYCRVYGRSNFPNDQGVPLTIDNTYLNQSNETCFDYTQLGSASLWEFHGVSGSIKSALKILAGAFQSNRTYQFMVLMQNRKNSSSQATGYVLVHVENTRPQMIAIGCVISTLCALNLEYQLVNPTTQVSLFSFCVGRCASIQNITWNVYQGSNNLSSNQTQWTLFPPMQLYQNIWFFGRNTSNFTSTNQLFLAYPQIHLWRYEVVYTFADAISSSSLNFIINQPPINGSCSIFPLNGTTSTLFSISCPDWFDQDGIKDYSLYTESHVPSQRMLIAFSPTPTFSAHLPAGYEPSFTLQLIVLIRDTMSCVVQVNLTQVTVLSDTDALDQLMNQLQSSSSTINNPLIQLVSSGNQNVIGQVLSSVSQQSNQINAQLINRTAGNGVPVASISVSSLASSALTSSSSSSPSSPSSQTTNQSALDELSVELNKHADMREYLIAFTTRLSITTSSTIQIQAKALVQLTESTNQLTRTTLTMASDRCYQLAKAINTMATQIPFEDVQMIVHQLSQCATNLLTAVNAPLQGRSLVLEKDHLRATSFPSDYDTDLEFPWANPNLFADGSDFSPSTLDRNRNRFYQKQLASEITEKVNDITRLLSQALNIHLNLGQSFTVNTSSSFMSTEIVSIDALSDREIRPVDGVSMRLPSINNLLSSSNGSISVRSTVEPLASFGTAKDSSNTNVSRSISLTLLDRQGNEIPFSTSDDHPFELIIPHDPHLAIPSMHVQNVTNYNSSSVHQLLFNLHYVNISDQENVAVQMEFQSMGANLSYLVIHRFDQSPLLNSSHRQIDGWTLFCASNTTGSDIFRYFLDNEKTKGHRSVIFGMRELNTSDVSSFCSTHPISSSSPPISDERFVFTSDYKIRLYTSSCLYLDGNGQWKTEGLRVGSRSNLYQTQCYSTHLTRFTSGLVLLPEPINWNYVFQNADFLKNKTIYLTVIISVIIYLLLLIYARHCDHKDRLKWVVIPLPDNHPNDSYLYEIVVSTGHRHEAGTKSKISFVLSGDEDETLVRTFPQKYHRRQLFQRNDHDVFLMAVPKCLGSLNYLHLWHDNSGLDDDASWFVKSLIIRDLQTQQTFDFVCQRWLAVEKEDGKIERLFPVSSEEERKAFSYLLSKETSSNLSDDHLWYSIFSSDRSVSDRFTRVQRCTCCFVLFFLSMFLNIMYYDLSQLSSSSSTILFTVASVRISSQQIVIGIIVEALALIPSLIVVQLFRRIRPRSQSSSSTKSSRKWTLPWWSLYLVYGLCLILVAVSIFMIIARGIEFGDEKAQKWLISILTGFFSSVLISQPLKVVCVTLVYSFICVRLNQPQTEHEEISITSQRRKYLQDEIYRPTPRFHRLTEYELEQARQERQKYIQMWIIIRQILSYFLFLALICLLTYFNRNPHSSAEVSHLRRYFLNQRQSSLDLSQIETIPEYWQWLEKSFIINLRVQPWYNGDPARYLNGFTNDRTHRLIGWPMMKQRRIQSTTCHDQRLESICEEDLHRSNEERRAFQPMWIINQTSILISANRSIERAFQYNHDHQGYLYEFRGRFTDLQSNLSMLHRWQWIDQRTRMILIHFSLYNPNIQLFTSVRIQTEVFSTGSLQSAIRIDPIPFFDLISIVELIFLIIYLIWIVYLMIEQVMTLSKTKRAFFFQFRSWVNIGIIVCSWIALAIYIYRYRECQEIGRLFRETQGYTSIDLQRLADFNDLLTWLLALCCFLGTIRLTSLCQYHQRLSLFTRTLHYASQELLQFAMMFSIIFTAFIALYYLLFTSKISTCATVMETARMLFEMSLLKFDSRELISESAFLGPICFTFFIVLIVFVCLSMFLTIINESFHRAQHGQKENGHESIFSYMWMRFVRWTGMKRMSPVERHEQQDLVMRQRYRDPVEHFPEKIDEFLQVINQLHLSQKNDPWMLQEDR